MPPLNNERYPRDFPLIRLLYSGIYGGGVLLYHQLNKLRGRVPAAAFAERCGRPEICSERDPIWVHASSMGEVRVAAGLIDKLAEEQPSAGFVCSVSTETGYKLAQNVVHERTTVVRAPVDLPGAVRSFLACFNPAALILIETEWWPNQLAECFDRGIPVFVANGRVSLKSGKRYRWVRRYLSPLLRRITRFYMRSAADAERLFVLGVDSQRVEVAGSLKNVADAKKLVKRTGIPAGPPVFLAGCTRPGEEKIILDAFRTIRKKYPALRLWLAPRHPDRFADVAGMVKQSGYPWAAYSVLPLKRLSTDESPAIIVIDKMGVLAELYQRARVAFVGGSLRPFGGHNPVEPVLAGAPVLFGPYTEEQADAASALEKAGLGVRVHDADSLAGAVMELIAGSPDLDDFNRRRQEFFAGYGEVATYVARDILKRLKMRDVPQPQGKN